MGILTKGILGGFQGTVGTVVGGTWKGISYIKSLPVISNTDPTPAQLEQRLKFKTVINFLKPMLPLVQFGFRNSAAQMTGYNAAMAYNYRHALSGTYPSFSIDYSFAAVTNGALPNVLSPAAAAAAGSVVEFSWTNNANVGMASETDKVILVLYCPVLNQAIYTFGNDLRSAESATLNAAQFSGKQVHAWISAVSADGRHIAGSTYTGMLTVS